MKFARVQYKGTIYHTTVIDNKYYPLNGDFYSYSAISKKPLDGIDKILAPIIPSKVVALGLNYKLHIQELHAGASEPSEAVIFIKPDTSVIGNNDVIVRPKRSERVDYEAELAFYISKDCRNVSPLNANDYILGYTCLNDVTARDLQKLDGQWTRAKGYDTFCPIGPYIVTDIDTTNLEVKAILNGKVVQQGNTRDMIHSIPKMLAYISGIMTLRKGDVITTGTPSGIGPMSDGDIIEIYVENVGNLVNMVKDE